MSICNVSDEFKMRDQISGKEVEFLDKNMFVEAGAGAGKTTLIVSRIVNQLKRGDAPGSFVVITFTNAAAEELRQRIITRVSEAAATNDNAKKALDHLDEMNISTIHSFCNVLLKEQPFLAGLPQDMQLIEGDEEIALKDKYFNEFCKGFTSKQWNEIKVHSNGAKNYKIKRSLQEMYNQIVDLPEDTNIVIPSDLSSLIKDAENDLKNSDKLAEEIVDEIFNSLQILISKNTEDKHKPSFANIEDAIEFENKVSSVRFFMKGAAERLTTYLDTSLPIEERIDGILALCFLSASKKNIFSSAKTSFFDEPALKAVETENIRIIDFIDKKLGNVSKFKLPKTQMKRFASIVNEAIEYEKYYICLFDYALKAREYYRVNRPKKYITNDNLIEFTRNLICNSKGTMSDDENRKVLDFYSKKYAHYYIDEFQDTDRVQAAFLYRLASDVEDEEKLRDGALFVVGDPKQSIYRFRGAQPEVYFEIKDKMSDSKMTNAVVYELQYNFRSNGSVIDWINDKFVSADTAMPIIDATHGYSKMIWKKDTPSEADIKAKKIISGVYHYGNADAKYINDNQESVKCTYTVSEDIMDVVNLILNLKNGGYRIVDSYDDNGKPVSDREIQFRDFLLIPLSMSKMAEYLEALKSYEIPVRFDGKTDLSVNKAMNTYVRLYWYLANPKERFHRMAAKEAIRENSDSLKEAVLEEYTDGLLRYLDYRSKGMSAFGKALYLESQISAIYEKNRDYDVISVYGIKTCIRQMIEYVFSKETGSSVKVASAFETYVATKLEHELSLEENADAVRFMNLHKTKGLEGEIVIMMDRRSRRKTSLGKLSDGDVFYPGCSYVNNNGSETTEWSSFEKINILKDKNEEDSQAEFHRLEYVAVTRAKQAVFFMNTISNNGIFATEIFNYEIDNTPTADEYIDFKSNSITATNANDYDFISKDGVALIDEDAEEYKYKPIYVRVNPSGLENESSPARIASKRANKESVTNLEELKETFKRPYGNILGDCLHRTMELVIDRFNDSAKDEEIVKVANLCALQAVREHKDDIPLNDDTAALERIGLSEGDDAFEEFRQYVNKAAYAYYKWLLDNKVMSNIKQAYTEMPFQYYIEDAVDEDGNKQPEWMNGTADLILEYEDGRILLIDYKSDKDFLISEWAMHESFSEIYKPQLDIYRKIVERVFKTPSDKIETAIISFSMREEDDMYTLLKGNVLRVRKTNL